MNLRYAKRFRAYAKKAQLLSVGELKTLGIKSDYEFEGFGFVDVKSDQVKKLTKLVESTKAYHFHTHHEGDNSPYFNDYAGFVNRFGYGLAHGTKTTDLHP